MIKREPKTATVRQAQQLVREIFRENEIEMAEPEEQFVKTISDKNIYKKLSSPEFRAFFPDYLHSYLFSSSEEDPITELQQRALDSGFFSQLLW